MQSVIQPGIKLIDMCEQLEECNRRLVKENGLDVSLCVMWYICVVYMCGICAHYRLGVCMGIGECVYITKDTNDTNYILTTLHYAH